MLQQRGVQGTCARGSWIPGLELNQQGRWQWGWRRTAQVRLLLPKDPDAGCVGLCGEGWGQGAQAGSRDTEGTVWGWGKEQSCCPGLRCGERTVQGWGGRDSPGWVLGAMDAASQEAWGPSACPPPGRASMAVGRPHHASCNGRAEGQDTGDAGVGHS